MTDDRKAVVFTTEAQMADRVVSVKSMLWNKTGSWRYLRPRYQNKIPPCNEGCPAGNDVEGFIAAIGQKRYDDAWRILKEENPLPRVTGRVCFHPCQAACNRKEFDQPTSIQALERFCTDRADQTLRPEPVREKTGKTVAVVGSGPAGLTAAYHLARLGHLVTILEDREKPGGVLRYGIPDYRLPQASLDKDIEDVLSLGVTIKTGVKVGEDITLAQLRSDYDAVFLGPGVHRSRLLEIPGEDQPGVISGLNLLSSINAGRPMELGRKVVVVGGGNTAIDASRVALRLGAEVDLIYRRSKAEMPAHESEIDDAIHEGVQMRMLCQPVEVISEKGSVVALRCVQMMLGDPDQSGRRAPEPVAGSEFLTEADTVVTAIGEELNPNLLIADLNAPDNQIAIDQWGQTNLPGLFAGGDAAGTFRTVADAIGAGKKAAVSIDRYLNGQPVDAPYPIIGERGGVSIGRYLSRETTHRNIGDQPVVRYDMLNVNYFDPAPQRPISRRSFMDEKDRFCEVNLGLDEADALADAARCFHCGVCNMCDNCYIFCPDVSIVHRPDGSAGYDLNLDYCKGCGICVHECPRNAMLMEEDQ